MKLLPAGVKVRLAFGYIEMPLTPSPRNSNSVKFSQLQLMNAESLHFLT
jgi:hypothetical protein